MLQESRFGSQRQLRSASYGRLFSRRIRRYVSKIWRWLAMSFCRPVKVKFPQISPKKSCRYFLIFETALWPSLLSEILTTRSSSGDRLRSRYPFRTNPAAVFVSVPGVTPS